MIETLLGNVDTLLLLVCAAGALAGAALMLVLRQPMRVAMALIATMLFLGGIYGLLGVHFIAAFQVLIYVGAVMVFMVYVIMLLEVRESGRARATRAACSRASAGLVVLLGVLAASVWRAAALARGRDRRDRLRHRRLLRRLPGEYWLLFELTSVLLVAAVVAALAVIRVGRQAGEGARWIGPSSCIGVAVALFSLGLVGVIVRRNVLVMLMCMELMLNGVNLSLVTFAQQTATTVGAVLVFLIFVVADRRDRARHTDRAAAGARQAHARPRRLQRAQGLGDAKRCSPRSSSCPCSASC